MASSRVKRLLASLLRVSGWFALRSQVMMKDKAVIFMYHRVLPQELVDRADTPVQPGMYVTPWSLRLHLSYLKTHFFLVSLTDLIGRLQAGEDIFRCAVVTFDDGWRDNYLYAFPVLKELNVPSTIFLATGLIGTSQWFWPEEIGWIVQAAYKKQVEISLLPDALSYIIKRQMKKEGDVEKSIDRIVVEMKSWDESLRSSVAKKCVQLRKKAGGVSERLLMSWDEVREMKQSGLVDFGSHTVTHALLDQLPLENVQQELVEAGARIHKEIGTQANFFAYPNGNYSPQVLAMLSETGTTVAVTTKRGLVGKGTTMLEMPRIAVHEDISYTQALFQWRLFVR